MNNKTSISAEAFAKNYNNVSVTEKGAIGYRTAGSALLDLNFKVSSLRNYGEEYLVREFVKAYYESPKYAVKWLFFLRDILEGLGERRTFRICLKYLAESKPAIAKAVLPYVSEYGRYDDVLVLLDTDLAMDVALMLKDNLDKDIEAMNANKPVSLLAKWLPSINTSSAQTKKYANKLVEYFNMSPKQYRQTLSRLRAYSNVLETYMSSSRWTDIDYSNVPAKANLKYNSAFERHDLGRRVAYYKDVFLGNENLNSKGLMPYEIVHRYTKSSCWFSTLKDDALAELMWGKLLEDGFNNDWGIDDAIVVADGSGSMFRPASGSSSVMAIDVCNSLAIYFAEQLKGCFHNKAITFSRHPQFIDFKEHTSLKEKLEIMYAHNEVDNTNIEAVFDLLLDMALCKNVPREELPKQVVIISDMEFDSATGGSDPDEYLFSTIADKYKAAGYKMPRLIFWNVCGRSDTIPMVNNDEGLCLLSGFSQNAMKIAANKEKKDPYEALIAVLDSPRYQVIDDAIEELVA